MLEKHDDPILGSLHAAAIELIVVGGTAAVLQGAPVVTEDLDVVHARTPANVDRLLGWLAAHGAHHRYDLMNRKLAPTRELLLGKASFGAQTEPGVAPGHATPI